ncbi:MAG: diguanylate cyclase domain-containing protein [Halothiobacillus sp.]
MSSSLPASFQLKFFNTNPLIKKLRANYWVFLSIPLLMFLAWSSVNEWTHFQDTKNVILEAEVQAGTGYARIIQNRIDNQYRQLQFAATLLDVTADHQAPDARTQQVLVRLKHANPELYALNLYAPDGSTRVWSDNAGNPSLHPITPPQNFTILENQPNYLFGQDQSPMPGKDKVLSMRYRVQAATGDTVFYLSAPYKLSALLAYSTRDLPWQFRVIDTRDDSVLGVWRNHQLSVGGIAPYSSAHAMAPSLEIKVPITGYPLVVVVGANAGSAAQLYWQNAKPRLTIDAGMLFLLLLGAWGVFSLMRERELTTRQLKRLAQFNALLAQVNQVIDRSQDETELLTTICSLAVHHGDLRLAFIARPDERGWFYLLTVEGEAMQYTAGMKLSINPDIPEGNGTGGQAWRSGAAFYVNDFFSNPHLAPWAERAAAFGLNSSATLPIYKNGVIWAIFSVYHAEKQFFDTELRITLEQLAQDITYGLQWLETQQREKNLTATQQALLNATLAGIMLVKDRKITQVNPRFIDLLGYDSADELNGQSTEIIYADLDEYHRVGRVYPSIIAMGKYTLLDIRLKKRDGSIVYVDLSGSLIEGTQYYSTVWTLQDITQRHQLQLELKQSAQFQRVLFEKNAAAMLIVDSERKVMDVNSALCALTGFTREELLGKNASLLHGNGADFEKINQHLEHTLDEVVNQNLPMGLLHCKDGRSRYVETLGATITLQNGEHGVLWSIIDITELHEAKQAITHQAMHDTLTDLPNRRALELWLPKALARARRKSTVVAVGMLDLDDFKPVNDNYGHAAGDQLLRDLAVRLQARLREPDLLVRLGGDEFVIVLEELDDSHVQEQLAIALTRLHQAVEQPFEVAPGQFAKICLSMGIALYPQDSEEGDSLLRQADAALYQLKTHKATRTQWWQLSKTESVQLIQPELSSNAYAAVNQDVLARQAPFLEHLATEFTTVFYRNLERDPLVHEVLSTLEPATMQTLIQTQAAHLLFVLHPGTTHEQLVEKATNVGRIHALVGVSSVLLMQALSLYRRLLTDFLNQSPMAARDRYQVLMIAESRLEDDILTQAQVGDATIQQYFALFTAPFPPQARFWMEVITQEIHPLSRCPGIQGVLLLRPDSHGLMTVESCVGEKADAIATILKTPGKEATLDSQAPRGQGLAAESWRTGEIKTSKNIQTDVRYTEWRTTIQELRIYSVMTIPILDRSGVAIAVLAIYGAYPHQFESIWMQQFSRNLQQRLNQIWLLCTNLKPSK